MSVNDPKPSQAEGEDPDRPTGPAEGTSGHPSQAEGEDPAHPAEGEEVSTAAPDATTAEFEGLAGA
ncbi:MULTISPECIES: hypothetical protein [Microbacterium]|uniref:Uncharacterized protein n=1 Tax=Microbacterium saccharophilum TaxID=1213358 RepID=A0A7Z7D023_9MICO|nr:MULTISPECIES: hypothetical protein [Microbacterium]SFI21733.1 hypothetical protein SAMN04487751_0443 [Microbacterium saccharophilum]